MWLAAGLLLHAVTTFACPDMRRADARRDGFDFRTCSVHDGTLDGAFVQRSTNGVLLVTGSFESGAPTGVWSWYDARGRLSLTGEFIPARENHFLSAEVETRIGSLTNCETRSGGRHCDVLRALGLEGNVSFDVYSARHGVWTVYREGVKLHSGVYSAGAHVTGDRICDPRFVVTECFTPNPCKR